MSKNKNQPFTKYLLWCIAAFVPLAAIFAGLIALTSKATFLVVFSGIMAFFAVIFIPMTIWYYTLEPLWWDKTPEKAQKKIISWGGGLIVVSVLLIWAGVSGGDTWSGKGQVDLFPEGSTSKNYILTADMKVTTKWWWNKDYKINKVEWPVGGSTYFSDCVLHNASDGFRCTDNDGNTWTVSIVQPPDQSDNNQSTI